MVLSCTCWRMPTPRGSSKHPKQNVSCRVSVFVGLGVLVVATPVSFIFINKLTNLQGDMLAHTDRRIALVNQLLAGMKSLKMYAWEAAQEARVRPSLKSLSSATR